MYLWALILSHSCMIPVWCIYLQYWIRIIYVYDPYIYNALLWYLMFDLNPCMYDAHIYHLLPLTWCDKRIHDALIHDSCMQEACMHDACKPDGWTHDSCTTHMMQICMMYVCMMHVCMLRVWSINLRCSTLILNPWPRSLYLWCIYLAS